MRKTVSCTMLVVAAAFLCAPQGVHAVDWGQEYATRIKATQVVSPLGDEMFGDEVNLFNGTLSFAATDVSIPGNSALPVRLARRLDTQDLSYGWSALGDWEIDAPYLFGTYPAQALWAPSARCSTVAAPPAFGSGSSAVGPSTFWGGVKLHSDRGSGDLLAITTDPKLVKPTFTEAVNWMTKGGWYFSCGTSVASGQGGEGFIGHAPDGTRYTFNWMIALDYPGILRKDFSPGGPIQEDLSISRKQVRLYATEIKDRFGNWVRYDWTGGRLDRIHSNDGRQITLQYASDGRLLTATAKGATTADDRLWSYEYANPANPISRELTAVVNPDLSRWSYARGARSISSITYPTEAGRPIPDSELHCWLTNKMQVTPATYAVTHPSGAKAEYTLLPTRHGSTNVFYRCNNYDDDYSNDYNLVPLTHDVLSLQSKRVTGPGLAERTYSYTYEGLEAGYAPKNPSTDQVTGATPPPHYKYVTVLEPDGTKAVHKFGKDNALNEGQLFQVDVIKGGVLYRRTVNTYVTTEEAATLPFPASMGNTLAAYSDSFSASTNRPLRSTVITQQGATFTSQVPASCAANYCFDAWARATAMTKFSSGLGATYSKTDTTTYHDNLSKWIVGQVATQATNGIQSAKTDYDANAMPWKTWAFGKLQQTLTYETAAGTQAGTLKTVTDGNSHAITLTNWHRGTPRSIAYPGTAAYPSGTTQSAVVDDNGWIKQVTDENGYVTKYDYDAMGRLDLVDYPDGDTVNGVPINWTSTTRNFSVQAGVYGLPNHWRMAERTGNGVKVVRYDALWRPVIEEAYDDADRDGTRSLVVKRYDSGGRLAFQSYPLRETTDFDYTEVTAGTYTYYDALGRPTLVRQTSELGNLDTTTQYLAGFKTRVVLPRHQGPTPTIYTDTTYQAWDQPTTEFPRTVAQPEGVLTTITRDAFGKPTAIVRSGGGVSATRSYAYNAAQELCRSVEPETGATLFRYDGAGNLTWSAAGLPATTACSTNATAPAAIEPRTVYRSYDARNRLEDLSFPDGNGDQAWTYWADGLPKIVTTWNIGYDGAEPKETRNHYTYSKRRLLETESIVVPEWYVFNLGYGYDANGHLTRHHYPSGHAVTYTVNALGQPLTLTGSDGTPYARQIRYYPNGAVDTFTYGNDIVHKMTQNARQLPATSRAVYGGTEFLDDTTTYDKHGNVTGIDDGLATNRSDRTMVYDDLDRLTDVTSPMYGGTGAHYTYDALDDLTRVRVGGTAARDHHYCYDAARRLTNVKTGSCIGATVTGLEYDLQGNLFKKNGQQYLFDTGNRLREVLNVERYRYDAHGRRVLAMAFGTGTVLSHYGLDGRLMYQKSDRTGKQTDAIYLGGSLVALREIPIAGGVATNKYQHTDALGSPVVVTSQNSPNPTVLERSEYEPYGKVLNRPMHDGPGYTGHVEDAATGMVYAQQRYFDPTLGRFLSVDPVSATSSGGNFNRYWYANNNPYRFTDPDGRAACPKGSGGSCVDSPRTESGTTPQAGPSSQQRAVDSQVKTASDSGRLSDGTKLNLSGKEQGFKASADGTSSNPMQTGCAKCSDGSTRETGSYNKGALGPNESGGHTHTDRTSGLPGPEDGRLANATDKSAYVISERGAFSVEKTEVGYRIRTIDGASPSRTERAEMRSTIDGWNQNQGGSGITCTPTQC